jgi:hypothetical protein
MDPLGVVLLMIFRRPPITAAAGEQPRGGFDPSLAKLLLRIANQEKPWHSTPDQCPLPRSAPRLGQAVSGPCLHPSPGSVGLDR